VRLVDVASESYQVALEYMIRLDRADLDDEDQLARLAKQAKTSPAAFRERLGAAAVG
jgi:hypothetical protein